MENLKGKPLVSVIVPIYNAEQYLTACVDALLAQTYTHIEILLVDDGSKDRSGILCDEYAQRDSRVRVLHLQNGGVSRARNHALEVMKGEWVCFADADDEVTPYYVEHFVDAMEEGIDVIISEVIFVHEEGRNERLSYKRHGTLPLTEIFSINELSAHGYACAKCYRTCHMRSVTYGLMLRFPEEIKYSEDLLFVMQYLEVSPQAKYISYADYIYYLRSSSASGKIFPMLFARVRNCMYMLGELTRKKRVWFYRSVTSEVKNTILNSLQSSNMLVRIGYKLFMANGYWYLLDAYFYVMMNLKRLLSKKR